MVTLSQTAATAPVGALEQGLAELERAAHHAATQTPATGVAGALQELLGQTMVAGITGISDAKTVGRWARGEREPRAESERRLRDAFQIATFLILAESAQTARAWFVGMNPHLRDRAPFAILAEDADSAPRVLAAARAFVVNG
ncbi:MAG: hypothetical protein QM692_17225 [Thermomicrobiales bacterium]